MPLRFDLGPGEKLFIGRTVLTNGQHRCHFVVDGDGPVLRERDVIVETAQSTAPERLYVSIQQTYLNAAAGSNGAVYIELMSAAARYLQQADIATLNALMAAGEFYRALRYLKKLLPSLAQQSHSASAA